MKTKAISLTRRHLMLAGIAGAVVPALGASKRDGIAVLDRDERGTWRTTCGLTVIQGPRA